MLMQEQLVAAVGSMRGVAAANRLCEAAVDLFGVDSVAISVVLAGVNSGTLGVSGPSANLYDELQFTLGMGPCLDAVTGRAPVSVSDLLDSADARWPEYVNAMLTHGVRFVCALPIVVAGEYVGALDLFRADPGPLDLDQITGALAAAELAGLPLLDLLATDRGDALDPDCDAWSDWSALSRIEVNQATGMLIVQLDVTAIEALAPVAGPRLRNEPQRRRYRPRHSRSPVAPGEGLADQRDCSITHVNPYIGNGSKEGDAGCRWRTARVKY